MKKKPTDKEIGKMFNVINGLKEDSNFGYQHILKYPEDKEETVRKYNEFVKIK